MSNVLELDLVWGGYYACQSYDNDKISVMRIIDFNIEAYHVALFKEEFVEIPDSKVIDTLSPYIGHAPIDARALLNDKSVTLIGRTPLNKNDLEGYMYYLGEFDVSEEERSELCESLIKFSNEPPAPLKLYLSGDELQIEERN